MIRKKEDVSSGECLDIVWSACRNDIFSLAHVNTEGEDYLGTSSSAFSKDLGKTYEMLSLQNW